MESNGTPGKILISENTKNCIFESYPTVFFYEKKKEDVKIDSLNKIIKAYYINYQKL